MLDAAVDGLADLHPPRAGEVVARADADWALVLDETGISSHGSGSGLLPSEALIQTAVSIPAALICLLMDSPRRLQMHGDHTIQGSPAITQRVMLAAP